MKTIITLSCLLIFIDSFCQSTYIATKYGISNLKKATELNPILGNKDSLEYTLLENSRNGSIGLDVFTQLDENKKYFFELGFYYSSTTLVGNSGFRYQFVYGTENLKLDTTIIATSKYGNMKIGFGRNLSKNEKILIMINIGLDLEYGETTIINPNFNIAIKENVLQLENIFIKNSLLVGPYFKPTFTIQLKNSYGLIATPCLKYSFKFEDDFENDKTNVTVSNFGLEFSAGIYKSF